MYDNLGMGNDKKLSLRPLKFKEAVADLLKVKPPAKEKPKAKKKPRKS